MFRVAYGALTGAVGGAADGRRSMRRTSKVYLQTRFSRGFYGICTHHNPLSADIAKNRMVNAYDGTLLTSTACDAQNGAFSTICNGYV